MDANNNDNLCVVETCSYCHSTDCSCNNVDNVKHSTNQNNPTIENTYNSGFFGFGDQDVPHACQDCPKFD